MPNLTQRVGWSLLALVLLWLGLAAAIQADRPSCFMNTTTSTPVPPGM
jgi:hypothetical protein